RRLDETRARLVAVQQQQDGAKPNAQLARRLDDLRAAFAGIQVELAAAQEARSRHEAARVAAVSHVHKVEGYLMRVASGAGVEEAWANAPPPPPARPRAGESFEQAITRTRGDIAKLRSELASVISSPPPREEIEEALKRHVAEMAKARPGFRLLPG